MSTLYGLTELQMERLRRMLSAFELGDLVVQPQLGGRRPMRPDVTCFGILESAIAATTGLATAPKSGTLSVYKYTSTGGTTDTGTDYTVYNFSPNSCTTDRWSICVRDSRSGNWQLIYQACS